MENTEFEIETQADIIAQDVDGKIVLLVKVSTDRDEHNNAIQLISTWKALRVLIPFAMFVDLETILIYKLNGIEFPKEPIVLLKTVDVLRVYEVEFGDKRIFYHYLVRLVEGWLRDLAYHWKFETPPALKELKQIGLLDKIEGGITQTSVSLKNLISNHNDREVLEKIQQEVLYLLPDSNELSFDNLPTNKQQKIKEVSERILKILYEYSK